MWINGEVPGVVRRANFPQPSGFPRYIGRKNGAVRDWRAGGSITGQFAETAFSGKRPAQLWWGRPALAEIERKAGEMACGNGKGGQIEGESGLGP